MKHVKLSLVCALLALAGCPGPEAPRVSKRLITMPEFTQEELARAESLRVVAATPTGEVERVSEADEILVTFDAPMVALEAVPETVDFPLLPEPDVPGSCHWLGTRTVAFRPDTFLPVATVFRVKIPRGVRAVGGQMLKADYEFTFSTVRPQLERSRPYHREQLVELRPDVWLLFNVPMDPRRAKGSIRLVAADGSEVGFRLRQPRRGEGPPDVWWYSPDDSARVLIVNPARQLRIQTGYTVVLEEGLRCRTGNLGLEARATLDFATFNRFRFEGIPDAKGHRPEDPLSLVFSNPVPLDNLLDGIVFRPPVKLPREAYDYATDHHYLSLELAPETDYEVVLSKWLRDKFGNRLGRDVRVRLRTLSYRPGISMPVGSGIVETGPQKKQGQPPISPGGNRMAVPFPVRMVNVESLAVRMRRLGASEVVPFWRARYDYDYEYEDPEEAIERDEPSKTRFGYQRIWRPKLRRNYRTLVPLDLAPGLEGRKSGYLFCELDMLYRPERGAQYRRAFLQVTPYGLTSKFSPENGLGLVTRLADCAPVADARVELRDDDNRVVWTGRTDRHGLIDFPGWSALGVKPRSEWDSPRVWMFAAGAEGEGFVHSDWGTGIYPYDLGVSYDWYPDPTEPKGFIFTEKGLYRAGDTVRIKGMVRYKQRGRWVLPKTRHGIIEVRDSRGEQVLEKRASLSDWGSFDASVTLAGDAATGYYSVTFEQDDRTFYGSFRVEAYRPAEFEVEVRADKKEYVASDGFSARVSGRYLFGAPMQGDAVSWEVSLGPSWFAPKGHEGFRFGAHMDDAVEGTAVIASGSGRLDELGQTTVKTRLDLGRRLATCQATCEATVTAKNERSISGRESYTVHRADRYIGVKPTVEFAEVGDSVGFDVIGVRPDGSVIAGNNVAVTVFRRTWRSARKAQTGGRYSWVSEKQDVKVAGFRVRTGAEPVRRWFRPDKPGYYWAKFETRDPRRNPVRTDVSFWVAGRGEAAWMMRDDDLIELVRDKESYRPGDTARILVKSPWTGVKALVTVERELVLDRFVTEIAGNADLVRVPVREDYLPNVFVSVVLLKGRTAQNKFGEQGEDLGKPGFKIGYVELPVDPEARRLAVAARTDKDEYRPGESVELTLEVQPPARIGTATDFRGRKSDGSPGGNRMAVPAEVTVAVVDLGVLKLTGYATPDPFGVFYAPRPLAVATAESRLHVIGQRNYGEKGEAAAGDGLEESEREKGAGWYEFAYREKFLETALWLPSVRTDELGRAKVSFKLPDNLTTWQVIAVAASGDRFGSADAKFKVNKPLLLTASLPRFVRPDDRFQAGVMVHNRTEKKMAVKVRASVAKGVELAGERAREVEVEPNQAVEVRFEYRCTGGDEAEFGFAATSGAEEDGLKKTLPVRKPMITEAVAVYEQTADSLAVQWVSAPEDAFSGVGGLEVTLASSGLAGLERGLEYLRTYPYDCLEQRLSKILPFIVAEDLVNTFGLSEVTGSRLRQFVGGELAGVPKYQDESGGFHFWTGFDSWDRASPYLSAYCMYVLGMAKRNGYEVPSRVAEQGKAYLLNWLGYGEQDRGWPYSVDEHLTTRALAVYALALWGANVESYLNQLQEKLGQLSVFGKAYLLKTLAIASRSGNAAEAERRIVEAMNNKLKLAPTTAHYEEESQGGWIFHSNVRTTACVLQALLESRGEVEFAEKAVRWLVNERKAGRWRTTQENVYVFDALATYYRVYEKTRPEFEATVRLEGKGILSRVFSGRSLETARRFVPIDSLAKGRQEATVVKRGAGRVYYGLWLTYAPRGELKPVDEGFRVERTVKPVGRVSGYVRGEQYLVTLRVHTTQDRLFVVVDDPLPAGFEIVNTSFATERQQSARLLEREEEAEAGFRWWGGFDHEEIYDDRYLLSATYLEKGVHTKTYLVKALTSGRFFMPPTKVEEMYTPEVFGRTGQQWLDIR